MNGDKSICGMELYSEDDLKRLARQAKDLVPQHDSSSSDITSLSSICDAVLLASSTPSQSATYKVAAWNTLSTIIDRISASNQESLQQLLWKHGVWYRAFELYIGYSQDARPKSSKQLLVTLGNAVSKQQSSAELNKTISSSITKYLSSSGSPRKTKACLQLLTQFLSKELLSLESVLSPSVPDCQDNDHASTLERLQDFLYTLLWWAGQSDFGSVTSRCITAVLNAYRQDEQGHTVSTKDQTTDQQQPVWASPLRKVIQDEDASIDQFRVHVFPVLFMSSASDYTYFVHSLGFNKWNKSSGTPRSTDSKDDESDTELLCAVLRCGKECGLVQDTDNDEVVALENDLIVTVHVRAYGQMLSHHSRDARLAGLSMLISSHAATRPMFPQTFRLLRKHLCHFFADTDANFRGEVFTLLQKLMTRLRAMTAVIARDVSNAVQVSNSSTTQLDRCQNFLQWLLRFLTWELRPTASYQRHISALKTLSIVVKSGIDDTVASAHWSKAALVETRWPFHVTIFSPGLRRLLSELLMDPFDDVRQTAASILSIHVASLSPGEGDDLLKELGKTKMRAEQTMLATGRADQADGVAYMNALVSGLSNKAEGYHEYTPQLTVLISLMIQLEGMLDNAQASLASAARRYPMHSLLTSVRLIINQQSPSFSAAVFERLSASLHRVWNTVKPVLCDDAPEGFIPDEAEDSTDMSTKDTLSYCWRALKESSLLLGTLLSNKALNDSLVAWLGDLCFTQLAELRHRGAFSTVAQTWIICCSRSATLVTPAGSRSAIESWYDKVLDILKNRTTINTRRSAGIPALVCGLLIADASGRLISRAFEDLKSIARQPVDPASTNESSLPQVHALNCVKDVLKNTRLGELSEQHVPQSLRLAADSLRSDAWAIRNCGLMLFRAVIDRLLGTSEAYLEDDAMSQKRISAEQHPQLLDVVLELLEVPEQQDASSTVRFEGVFPALQMLQRIQLSPAKRDQAQEAVLALTASSSWHVRDKAARTYAAIADTEAASQRINLLVETSAGCENALHGSLLCIRYVTTTLRKKLERQLIKDCPARSTWMKKCLAALDMEQATNDGKGSPVVKAAFVDVITEWELLNHYTKKWDYWDGIAKIPSILTRFGTAGALIVLLRTLLDTDWKGSGANAVLRSSLARGLAQQIPRRSRDLTDVRIDVVRLLTRLGRTDPDACGEFWKTLSTVPYTADTALRGMADDLLCAAKILISDKFECGLRCAVQKYLLTLQEDVPENAFLNACKAGSSPLAANSNQIYADQWLQLQAVILDMEFLKSTVTSRDVAAFVSACKEAVGGEGLYSREAATLAIGRMTYLWPVLISTYRDSARDACLIVYDLLNDDDEDIRLDAAQITSQILRTLESRNRNIHFEPITASQELLEFMVQRLPPDTLFAEEAMRRAFNIQTSVADQLAIHSQTDTSLFAQEKQNLYIDEARETKAWSQVLLCLPPFSVPRFLLRRLASWTKEGLQTLIDKILGEGDNVLDRSSNGDVFTLGLQVIYAVEVLMGFVSQSVRLTVKPSGLVKMLAVLEQALSEADGNVLWRWEVERVLGRILEGRINLALKLADEVHFRNSQSD